MYVRVSAILFAFQGERVYFRNYNKSENVDVDCSVFMELIRFSIINVIDFHSHFLF